MSWEKLKSEFLELPEAPVRASMIDIVDHLKSNQHTKNVAAKRALYSVLVPVIDNSGFIEITWTEAGFCLTLLKRRTLTPLGSSKLLTKAQLPRWVSCLRSVSLNARPRNLLLTRAQQRKLSNVC
jgi:hypothetical protein